MKLKRANLLLAITLVCLMSFSVMAQTNPMTADNVTVWLPHILNHGFASGGNVRVNLSYVVAEYGNQNWSSANIYIQSAGLTANSTLIKLNASENSNNYTDNITASFKSTGLEDGTDYTLTLNLFNGSTYLNKSYTLLRVDNTVPTTPSSLVPVSDTDNDLTFSSTVGGTSTTACTLYFLDGPNPGSSSYTMTHSSDNCSYTLTNVPEQTYNWYVQASDGTNTTNSAKQTTSIDVKTGSGKIFAQTSAKTLSVGNLVGNIPTGLIIFIVVAVIIGFIIYFKK